MSEFLFSLFGKNEETNKGNDYYTFIKFTTLNITIKIELSKSFFYINLIKFFGKDEY